MAKKTKHDTHHEYTSIKQHQHGIWFRLSNICVLILMLSLEKIFDVQFGEYVYVLVFCAILGYDMVGLLDFINKFIGKRKKA